MGSSLGLGRHPETATPAQDHVFPVVLSHEKKQLYLFQLVLAGFL